MDAHASACLRTALPAAASLAPVGDARGLTSWLGTARKNLDQRVLAEVLAQNMHYYPQPHTYRSLFEPFIGPFQLPSRDQSPLDGSSQSEGLLLNFLQEFCSCSSILTSSPLPSLDNLAGMFFIQCYRLSLWLSFREHCRGVFFCSHVMCCCLFCTLLFYYYYFGGCPHVRYGSVGPPSCPWCK